MCPLNRGRGSISMVQIKFYRYYRVNMLSCYVKNLNDDTPCTYIVRDGTNFFFIRILISWSFRKQAIITCSNTKLLPIVQQKLLGLTHCYLNLVYYLLGLLSCSVIISAWHTYVPIQCFMPGNIEKLTSIFHSWYGAKKIT